MRTGEVAGDDSNAGSGVEVPTCNRRLSKNSISAEFGSRSMDPKGDTWTSRAGVYR